MSRLRSWFSVLSKQTPNRSEADVSEQKSKTCGRIDRRTKSLIGSLALLACVFSSSSLLAEQPTSAAHPRYAELLKSLHVPEGYQIELAAGAPLVKHPTMACLDDRGRLYVCDNAGVNMTAAELEAELPNSIRMLEDTDGDGIYDRSTLFADKMTFPMGGCWIDGSLYVASAPHIWKLTDTDGDGIADERIPIVSKFGSAGNAADIHGCFAGPDGRLYWCGGFHGHEVHNKAGELVSKRFSSYIFSCKTDGTDFRLHCGGGMDNPVEVDFTENGDILGTVNIIHTRPRVDGMVHWLHGGAYPHRERSLEEMKTTGPLLEPFHNFGHVAISGTVRYRSETLNPAWRDHYFATFFNLGKVVRLELTPQGSTYNATQREFLASDDRDFHPTDVLEDIDGSLLVLDTGGWFYRGCPTSQISKPELLGGIYRIKPAELATTAEQRASLNGNQIDWKTISTQELLKLTTDASFRVRERATDEAAKRGTDILPAVTETLQNGTPAARRQAVWILSRLLTAKPEKKWNQLQKLLSHALKDQHAEVRQVACHALVNSPDPQAVPLLIELLQDNSPSVRRMAATALGRSGDSQAVSALLQATSQAADREEEHACLYALIELGEAGKIRAGLDSKEAKTRRGSLIVLDQIQAPELTPELLVNALSDTSPEVQQTALQVLRRKSHDPSYLQKTREFVIAQVESDQPHLAAPQLAELLSLLSSDDPIARLIGQVLNQAASAARPAELPKLLIKSLSKNNQLKFHSSWEPFLRQVLATNQPDEIEAVLPLIRLNRSGPFMTLIQEVGQNEELPRSLRLQLLTTLPAVNGGLNPIAFEMLLESLEQPESQLEKGTAAQLLGNSVLSQPQLVQLTNHFPLASTTELRELIRPYIRNTSAEVASLFVNALSNSRFVANIPQQEISDIIKSYPTEQRELGNQLLDRLRKLEQEKLSQVDRLLPLLEKGDVKKGRDVYFSQKSKCATCHRVGNEGQRVGPDLTTIGANRASRDLLESILFPSATIVRDYNAYTVVLADGRVLTGLIAHETQEAIDLQQPTGSIEKVLRDEIDEMSPSEISLMPSGLEKDLTEQELADLIAYLASLK